MLRRTHNGSTMDTVVATEADAPRRRGAKFKLTYRQIYEVAVAMGPSWPSRAAWSSLVPSRRSRSSIYQPRTLGSRTLCGEAGVGNTYSAK